MARQVLLCLFVAMFAAQALVAVAVGTLLVLLAPSRGELGNLAWFAVALAVIQLPLGLALGSAMAKAGGRGQAMAATLLGGVLFSSPVWFLALAVAARAAPLPLGVLTGLAVVGFWLGLLRVEGMSRSIARESPVGGRVEAHAAQDEAEDGGEGGR